MKLLFVLFSLVALNAHAAQCPDATSDVREVEAMIRSLGYKAPITATLAGDVGGVATRIRMYAVNGELQFDYQRQNRIKGSAEACMDGREVRITSYSPRYGENTFVLSKGSAQSLRIKKPGIPFSAELFAQ